MPTRDDAWPQGTPCWIDCQVDDTTKAREFYAGLFGWEIYDSPEEAGGYLMAMKQGKPAAGIGPKPQGMPMPSAWTTYFAADSADDIAAKVADQGGQTLMPPFDVLDVGRMFVAADPTGAPFGVWQARAHTGAGVFNEDGAYCGTSCTPVATSRRRPSTPASSAGRSPRSVTARTSPTRRSPSPVAATPSAASATTRRCRATPQPTG